MEWSFEHDRFFGMCAKPKGAADPPEGMPPGEEQPRRQQQQTRREYLKYNYTC